MSGRRHPLAIGIAIACLALIAIVALGFQPIARGAAGIALRAAGYGLTYDRLAITPDHAAGENVRITDSRGEPVLSVASVQARYSIWDALRGVRQYGIASFDLERPQITLIRHKDGTWNVALPQQQQNAAPSTTPLIFDGIVRNGSLDVFDQAQGVPSARHLVVRKINAVMNVATNARTTYRAGLAYDEAGQQYPLHGSGTIDARAGYGMQRWSVPELPIAHIVDVAVNSPSFHVVGGSLRNVDAAIVGLPSAGGSIDEHVDVTARLDRARIAIGGLRKPLRDAHGELAVYGDGLLLQRLDATIAGVPVRLGGGIYHLSDPNFRLTVAGNGDLHDLRTVLAQSSSLPVSGHASLNVVVEGRPSKPLILIGLQSPRVHYANATLDRSRGVIAFDGQEADIVDFQTRYLGIAMRARGKAALHAAPRALEVLAGIESPANTIPYASAIAPGLPIEASILATSDTLRTVDGRGIVTGRNARESVVGLFDVNGNGVGTVGPLEIQRGGGSSLYAMAFVDKPHRRIDALADASHFGVAMPQLAATLDGRISGSYDRGAIHAGGWTRLHDVRTPFTTIAQADARFGEGPHRGLALAMDASGIGALRAVATAMLTYQNGTVTVRDAAASSGGTFLHARGSIANLTTGTPRYDVRANVHAADLSSVVALVQPRSSRLLEGSGEAHVRIGGSGSEPSIHGTVHAPEGAVNGLPFHAFDATIAGTPSALDVRDGFVGVGTTNVGFNGAFSLSQQQVAIRAPRANLADFNDFFDQGDMLGGTGSIIADASLHGRSIVTNGNVALHAAQVRNFSLGAATASWHTAGNDVATTLAFGGPNGNVHAHGAITTSGGIAGMAIRARDVNVGNWIAMSGHAMPIAGFADADATLAGRFPMLRGTLHAHAHDGSVERIPVERLDLAATLDGNRGVLHALNLNVPHAAVSGSGTFGLRTADPLALAFNAHTNDVGALARTISGKAIDASGAAGMALTIRGTRANPQLTDRFAGTQLRYGRFTVPHVSGEARADNRSIALARTQINLQRGRLLLNGSLPIALSPMQIDPRNRPIAVDVTADDIETSNVAALLPSGTHLTGRLDGRITARGTVHAPQLGGLLTFANGSFSGPQETIPIQNIGAQIALAGTSATLRNTHASVGGGTIDADGRASIPDVHDASRVAMQLNARANNARIDAPQYIKGRFDGDLHVTKVPGTHTMLTGTVATDSARIPLTALYNPKPANAPSVTPPDVGLGLHVVAGRDVRVQSPNVDVGAEGFVDVAGTLASPSLSGAFTSTGGTVSFLRTFRIQSGTVSFDPSNGIIPDVDAVATTHIDDPATDVALHVTGPATGLNLALASTPQYDRSQILGLLVNAQALGAVQGVASTGQPHGTGGGAVSQMATGQLNELFTRNLLEPFDVAAGGALGLANLQITNDLQGGMGLNAVKAFGKTMSLIFADTFNEPRRQSLTLQAHPTDATQYSVAFYNTQGATLLGLEEPTAMESLQDGYGNTATMPMDTGANGVDFKLQHKFPFKVKNNVVKKKIP